MDNPYYQYLLQFTKSENIEKNDVISTSSNDKVENIEADKMAFPGTSSDVGEEDLIFAPPPPEIRLNKQIKEKKNSVTNKKSARAHDLSEDIIEYPLTKKQKIKTSTTSYKPALQKYPALSKF